MHISMLKTTDSMGQTHKSARHYLRKFYNSERSATHHVMYLVCHTM